MERVDINANWLFERLGSGQAACRVDLPHDAMLAEPRRADCPGGSDTGWFEGRDYRYIKTLNIPAGWRGKTVLVELEGAYHRAEVYVNDQKAGFRPYGYMGFTVDITPFLHPGAQNTLTVLARNADQPNSRWYSGAGLYRPVWLWVGDAGHCLPPDALRVKTCSLSPAVIEVSVQAQGSGTVAVTLRDGAAAVACAQAETDAAGSAVLRFTLDNAQLWSPGTPHLYTAEAAFGGDTARTTFGIRTLGWNAREGFTLNGARVILRGACIHHDNGLLGACCYPDAEERKIEILRRNGYNAVRSAHNPCSKAMLDACDRLGMLVMDEYVDCWYIHKTAHDYVTYFADWWRQDLRDMAARDYNHPSVVLYSTGNEVSETAQPRGIALTGEMTRWLHAQDDTRPVTCGINIFFNLLSSLGFGVYSDKKAQKSGAGRKKKAVGSEFYNTLAGLFGDTAMKRGATLHGCDVKTRDAYANMDIAGYNYGILRYRHDLKTYPDRLILGTETFCRDAAAFWDLAQKEPRLIGDFVWAGFDYLGEVGIGAWEYADYAPEFSHGPGWITAGSGRIDLTGLPIGEAAYTQVALGQTAGPRIAVQPVCHTGRHSPSAWKLTNARESWSWSGCEGAKATVEVYARAAFVALYLNGRFIGKKRNNANCRVLFRLPYEDGELKAVACDEAGQPSGSTVLRTAGAATVLRVIPETPTVRPGGLCYLRLRYTDADGIVKPAVRGTLQVQAAGGRLLAVGNACPYNARGYLTDTADTYYGEAMAIVLADGSGPVTVSVRDGKQAAEAVVPCKEEKNAEN